MRSGRDDRRIAFMSDRGGKLKVYIVSAEGSEEAKLAQNSAEAYADAWFPPHQQIAFAYRSIRICVVRADGRDRICLSGHGRSANQLSWSL